MQWLFVIKIRGGSRTAAISQMDYCHKTLHLGCCSSVRSASENMYRRGSMAVVSLSLLRNANVII